MNFKNYKQMKSIFLSLAVFFTINFCFSQENGIVTYTITHNWVKKYASCDYLSNAERERHSYVYGNRNVEFVENAELKFNAAESRFDVKKNEDLRRRNSDDYIIYRDHSENKTSDVMTLLENQYVIQDFINCQNWKIKNDMKEIAGRICMNASFYDTIKKKEVIAWFALDLPIPVGPDIYCGLPGMILEINEADGAVIYTATNILFSDEKIEIEKPVITRKQKIINLQEYYKIVTDCLNQYRKMQRPYFFVIPF